MPTIGPLRARRDQRQRRARIAADGGRHPALKQGAQPKADIGPQGRVRSIRPREAEERIEKDRVMPVPRDSQPEGAARLHRAVADGAHESDADPGRQRPVPAGHQPHDRGHRGCVG